MLNNSMISYDLSLTLQENKTKGPPPVPNVMKFPKLPYSEWLGFPLQSCFGVAASPLTMNSSWVQWISNMGYDFLTYKTVRSAERKENPFPNWIVADTNSYKSKKNTIVVRNPHRGTDNISMANSFGVQSPNPKIWLHDYEKAKSYMKNGQILILSVMPTVKAGTQILDDIDKLSEYVNQTSAEVIELNLACPNSDNNLIYLDINLSAELCKRLRLRMEYKKKLIIKIGYYDRQQDLFKLISNTVGVIDGITSINTVPMNVVNEKGEFFFGKDRKVVGVSGSVIKHFSREQFHGLVEIRKDLSLEDSLGLVAVGGVSSKNDIDYFTSLGKNIAVQSVTGVWQNPLLAYDYKKGVTY